jgi:hypothetical protein
MKDSERLDRNERRNSLAAFLRAIKFRKPTSDEVVVEQTFAQPKPRARQRKTRLAEEYRWVRSAN